MLTGGAQDRGWEARSATRKTQWRRVQQPNLDPARLTPVPANPVMTKNSMYSSYYYQMSSWFVW